MEGIVIDHLLLCRRESVKAIVIDNVAVRKSWSTTFAMTQFFLDQELPKFLWLFS